MIKEVAILNVKLGEEVKFEKDFALAGKYISLMKGYKGHTLSKCVEESNKYLLLVNWDTLEDHTVGFRKSKEYIEWKRMLHHYYDPFPKVEHYETVIKNK